MRATPMVPLRRAVLVAVAALAAGACTAPGGSSGVPADLPHFPPGPPPPPMAALGPDTDEVALVGPVWAWQQTLAGDDVRTVPAAPDHYTLQFQPDGRVAVRADCNRGSASYVRDEHRLSLGPTALTRMACPPGSQDAAFLQGLGSVASFHVAGSLLVLELGRDAGTMQFRALPR